MAACIGGSHRSAVGPRIRPRPTCTPALGRFLQRDPLAGVPGLPLSLNRYSYAGNNPTSATDPSGLLTYFIGGIGGSRYPAFVQALQANFQDMQPQVCAFESCSSRGGTSPNLGGNLPLELARAAFAAGNPLADSDAPFLASQVKRDSFRFLLSGEQLNLIGYSGGATVAFDTAAALQQYGIHVDNIVTLGGFVFRGKPGNVGTWTEIIGDADPIASLSAAAVPDAFYEESGVTHIPKFPVPGLPSYLTGNGLVQSLNDIQRAGLR
jgi:pimeloyl-ACP methyl ester carboxylesterase